MDDGFFILIIGLISIGVAVGLGGLYKIRNSKNDM